MADDMQNKAWLVTGDASERLAVMPFGGAPIRRASIRKIVKFGDDCLHGRQNRIPLKRKQRPTPNSKT
jgi:hypothetical protein